MPRGSNILQTKSIVLEKRERGECGIDKILYLFIELNNGYSDLYIYRGLEELTN